MHSIDIMEVGGFRVGHAEYADAATGCTAILFDDLSPAGVSIRGSAPASRTSRSAYGLPGLAGCSSKGSHGDSIYF